MKGQLDDPNLRNNTAKASINVVPAPVLCRENLYFVTHWDRLAYVGTVKVYLDGRRVRTLHGREIRQVKISPPPAVGEHSVTVMFIIDPWHTVNVTRGYRNCMSGATSFAYPPATSPGAS